MARYYNKNSSGLRANSISARGGGAILGAGLSYFAAGKRRRTAGSRRFPAGGRAVGMRAGKRGRRKRKGQAEYKRITRSRGFAHRTGEGTRPY